MGVDDAMEDHDLMDEEENVEGNTDGLECDFSAYHLFHEGSTGEQLFTLYIYILKFISLFNFPAFIFTCAHIPNPSIFGESRYLG